MGLHPDVIKSRAEQGVGLATTAHGVVTGLTPVIGALSFWATSKDDKREGKDKAPSGTGTPKNEGASSSWGKWAAIGGVVAATGAAATAWYHREQLTSGVTYGWSYVSDQ